VGIADYGGDDDGVDGDFDGGACGWRRGLGLLSCGAGESKQSEDEEEGGRRTWVADHVT
jgi:hypothetical protein